jgi:hypothetical protein
MSSIRTLQCTVKSWLKQAVHRLGRLIVAIYALLSNVCRCPSEKFDAIAGYTSDSCNSETGDIRNGVRTNGRKLKLRRMRTVHWSAEQSVCKCSCFKRSNSLGASLGHGSTHMQCDDRRSVKCEWDVTVYRLSWEAPSWRPSETHPVIHQSSLCVRHCDWMPLWSYVDVYRIDGPYIH